MIPFNAGPYKVAKIQFHGIQTVVTYVRDVAAAAEFYEGVLGLPCVYRNEGVAAFDTGGPRILLHPGLTDANDPRQGHSVYWNVDDVDGLIGVVRGAGCEIVQEPTDTPWGERDASFLDPDGYQINVTQSGPDSWTR